MHAIAYNGPIGTDIWSVQPQDLLGHQPVTTHLLSYYGTERHFLQRDIFSSVSQKELDLSTHDSNLTLVTMRTGFQFNSNWVFSQCDSFPIQLEWVFVQDESIPIQLKCVILM